MPRITAIHGGGDWHDASADYLVLPDGCSVEEEHAKWREWYRGYAMELRSRPRYSKEKRPQYISFVEWLMAAGGREPTEEELCVFVDL